MKNPREPSLPNWLAWTLGVSLATIIVLMPFHAFVSTWGGTIIGPLWLWKSWKELVLVGLVVPALVWVLSNKQASRVLFRDRLVQIVLVFAGLTLVVAVLHTGPGAEAESAGLAMNLRYLVIAFLAYVLLRFGRLPWKDIFDRAKTYLIGIGVVLSLLGILQVTVVPHDFLAQFGYDKDTTIAPFTLIDDNPDARRAFATLRGPNDFGAFLILPLLVALVAIRKLAWRIPVTGVIALGIVVSGSRSAWLGALIALAALGLLVYGRTALRSKRVLFLGVALGIVTIVIGLAALSVPSLRLAIFHSSPGDPSLTEGSTEQHWLATAGGIERVSRDPLGCGVGCAGPASYYGDEPRISENYYVQIAEEVGVVGLTLWLTVAYFVAKRLYEQKEDVLARALLASFVGLSAIGFWLHVWSDDPLSLTWWGLTGAVLGYYASGIKKKTVK